MTAAPTCRRCDGALGAGAAYCSLCFMPVADPGEMREELAAAADDRSHYRWESPSHLTASAPPPAFSRWSAGPTSLGPAIKIGLTIPLALLFAGDGWLLLRILRSAGRVPHPEGAALAFLMVSTAFTTILCAAGIALLWRRRRVR